MLWIELRRMAIRLNNWIIIGVANIGERIARFRNLTFYLVLLALSIAVPYAGALVLTTLLTWLYNRDTLAERRAFA